MLAGRAWAMRRNEDIAAAVARNRPQMKAMLTEMVNCGSYTHNPDGVDRVAEIVAREMPACFQREAVESDGYAQHHRFSHVTGPGLPTLMAGHMDTLCPPDGPVRELTERGDRLVGPGVNDMKGGLAVLIWSLKVLEQCGLLDDLSVVCLFNSDEEVGSPTSARLFREMEGRASRALVFECGGPEGTVVTTRKGCLRYRLTITGEPSHFGNLKGRKASAALEMAHKTIAFEALNAADGSLAANVGRVEGGLAANAVAEHATMDVDLRYWTAEAEQKAMAAIEEINASASGPGLRSDLTRLSYRPPLRPSAESMRMFDLIVRLAAELGQPITEEKRGGLSDANWLSHVGVPTIDGLGPCGDGDFTPDEFIFTETLFQRVELVAHLLLALKGRLVTI